MTLPKPSKPALAVWIVTERRRIGLKTDGLAAAVTRLGYPVTESTVRGWEAGAKPGASGIRTLARLFESEPPVDRDAGDLSALVTALIAQTKALNRLADALGGGTGAADPVALPVKLAIRLGARDAELAADPAAEDEPPAPPRALPRGTDG